MSTRSLLISSLGTLHYWWSSWSQRVTNNFWLSEADCYGCALQGDKELIRMSLLAFLRNSGLTFKTYFVGTCNQLTKRTLNVIYVSSYWSHKNPFHCLQRLIA